MPGLGLAGGFGQGAGAESLRGILQRRFREAIAQQEMQQRQQQIDETQRQFNVMQPLRERGVAVDEGNLGLRRDEFGFDVEGRQAATEAAQQREIRLDQLRDALPPEQQAAFDAQRFAKINLNELVPNEDEYTLGPGARRYRGSKLIAEGGPQLPPSGGEPLVQVVGPDGNAIYVPRSQAVGQRAATARKPVLGQERQSLAYFNRAQEAAKVAEPLENEIAQMGLLGQTGLQYLPNFMQTQTGQSYRQAQRAFTEARLRKESGAAIPQGEYDNDARTYFAQPGDSADTIAQKKAARQEVLDGLGFSAGQAYEEFYGEPFGRKAPSASGTTSHAPPVVKMRFVNGQWVKGG